MRDIQRDTPPSSVNGDEIEPMDDEIYEEIDEEQLEDMLADNMEEDGGWEPPEDHACMVFEKHTKAVFCCDFSPNGLLAVTGGEDDKAYVWSVENGEKIMECTGHKDSVVFAGFSFDGAYLAAADMVGLITVWEVKENGPWAAAFEYETEDLAWGLWHFGARVLIFGVESGDIYVFKVPSGETKILKGNNIKVECGKLFNDGKRLAAGYEDGTIKIWDLKTSSVISQVPSNVHQNRVTAIDIQPDDNLVASISADGKCVLSTPSNGKVVGQLQTTVDLETVSFSQEPAGYLGLGTLEGAISIWDVSKQMVRHHCTKADDPSTDPSGVTKMIWIKNHLVVGCLDGSVRVYDHGTGDRKQVMTGNSSAILDLAYNTEKKLILTASDDCTARVFKYEVD